MNLFLRGVVRALDVQLAVAHDPTDEISGGDAVHVFHPMGIGRAEVFEVAAQDNPALIVGNPQA